MGMLMQIASVHVAQLLCSASGDKENQLHPVVQHVPSVGLNPSPLRHIIN